jgi:hypothetical protein
VSGARARHQLIERRSKVNSLYSIGRYVGVMRWWWLARPSSASVWSTEERQTVWRIHLIALPLFAVGCYFLVMFLFNCGFDPAIDAFVGVALPCMVAFALARRIALWLWPELLRRADENAARRYASYFTG